MTITNVISLAISGNNIFGGTDVDGLFLSTNNGNSWTTIDSGLTNNTGLSFAFSGSDIYAGTDVGLYLSINNGSSWTERDSGLPYTINSLLISGNNIFAATGGGVYLSTDSGNSWTADGLGSIYVEALAISGNNIFAGAVNSNIGAYMSVDSGSSWTAVSNGLSNYYNDFEVTALAASGSSIFAVTNRFGVFLFNNNDSIWTRVDNGLTNTSVSSLAVSGSNIYAGADGVFLFNKNDSSWTAMNNGFPYSPWVTSLAISDNYFYVGIQGAGVWKFPLSQITGIEKYPANKTLSVYPNPSSGIITISLDREIKNGAVSVLNVMGEKVYTETFNGKQQTINCKLSAGIYFMRMRCEEGIYTQKVVIE